MVVARRMAGGQDRFGCRRRSSVGRSELARYGPGMMRRPVLTPRLLLGAGSAAVMVGVVVFVIATAQPITFSAFAYAPVSDATFSVQGVHVFSTASLVGAVVIVAGLLAVAAWFGYRQGLRREPDEASL
jgi:hypothetical protein